MNLPLDTPAGRIHLDPFPSKPMISDPRRREFSVIEEKEGRPRHPLPCFQFPAGCGMKIPEKPSSEPLSKRPSGGWRRRRQKPTLSASAGGHTGGGRSWACNRLCGFNRIQFLL